MYKYGPKTQGHSRATLETEGAAFSYTDGSS